MRVSIHCVRPVPLPHDTVATGPVVTEFPEASITVPDASVIGLGVGVGVGVITFFRKSQPQGATDPQVEHGFALSAGTGASCVEGPGVALTDPMITPVSKRIKGTNRRPHATKSAPC